MTRAGKETDRKTTWCPGRGKWSADFALPRFKNVAHICKSYIPGFPCGCPITHDGYDVRCAFCARVFIVNERWGKDARVPLHKPPRRQP